MNKIVATVLTVLIFTLVPAVLYLAFPFIYVNVKGKTDAKNAKKLSLLNMQCCALIVGVVILILISVTTGIMQGLQYSLVAYGVGQIYGLIFYKIALKMFLDKNKLSVLMDEDNIENDETVPEEDEK